jgi:F-type H+-transporting ATPase subunit b
VTPRSRKIGLVVFLIASIAFVTAVAVAQETHCQGPDTPHRGDPDSHDQVPDPKHEVKGHQTEHAADHGDEHHGPAPINWTDLGDKHRPAYIALLVNFGLLVGLYYTLGKKPIAEGLKNRRITIGKDIEEARKMLAEAKERASKYQADLKNADADAATAKAALIAAGKGEVERLLAEANEKAERMKRDAVTLVEQERKQIHRDLLLETIDRSVEEATKTLEKVVTAEDHARLANDLLAELAKRPAARPQAGGTS